MALSKDARTRFARLKQEYAEALEAVAEHLARVEGLETQQVSHFERARAVLMGRDSDQRPWWRRPAVWRDVGMLVVSISIAWFGIAFGVLCPGGRLPTEQLAPFWTLVVGVPVGLLVTGISLAVAGWVSR
jgi:hypothetical protein